MSEGGQNPSLPVRPIDVRNLPRGGRTVHCSANEEEARAIAAHADALELGHLDAELTFRAFKKSMVRVAGRLDALIVTACPVSLEPVEQRIEIDIAATFVPENSDLARPEAGGGEIVVDFDADDPPEPFDGASVDAWAIVLEHLLLAIDPFARADDARLPGDDGDEAQSEADPSPFAVLKQVRELDR